MVATSANHNIYKKNAIQLRREPRNPGISVVWLLHQLINHHNLLSRICYDHGLIANVGVDWVFGVRYTSWYWHTYLLTTNHTNGKFRLIMAQIIIRLFSSSQSYESQGHQIQWSFSLDCKLHSGQKWRGNCLVPMIWNFVEFSHQFLKSSLQLTLEWHLTKTVPIQKLDQFPQMHPKIMDLIRILKIWLSRVVEDFKVNLSADKTWDLVQKWKISTTESLFLLVLGSPHMIDVNKKFRIELRWRKTRWSKLVIWCNSTQNHRTSIFLGKTKFTIVWDCSNLVEFLAPQCIVLLSIWLSLLQCGVKPIWT
jgi:hypothetical protein